MSSHLSNQVNGVLEQFGAQVGVPSCALDDEGGLEFALDNTHVSLLLDEDKGALLMLSTLGRPPATAETYGRLLDANFFWSDFDGVTLARDSISQAIVLQRSLAVEGLDYPKFEQGLQRFVETAERLVGILGAEETQEDEAGERMPTTTTDSSDHFIRG
ncbi:type III secretion system chaperone [Hyphomicrobium sp. MC1]|uniref:type III secretion system chaperone n=1 Tax=Hyphomicrobium sp. (strain MC1) TaxID=717785 RepID=UPI000213EFE2|nr:type III secretion system chaperone [Hyphomicrobium sp. MC1]CCB66687.1 protein of unknown function [Hyphomicrobium sp. MC1]